MSGPRVTFSKVFDVLRKHNRPMSVGEITEAYNVLHGGDGFVAEKNVSGVLSRHKAAADQASSPPLVYRVQRGVWGVTPRGEAHIDAAKPDTEQTLSGRIKHPASPPHQQQFPDHARDVRPAVKQQPNTLLGFTGEGQPVHIQTNGRVSVGSPKPSYQLMAEVDESHVLLRAPSGRVYLARLKEVVL